MSGIDTSQYSRSFGALIGAILYIAVYLSLLNLLRYPRNWRPPNISSALVTGTLAVVMVAFVSLSSGGTGYDLNLGLLLFSAGFNLLLFGIISAPAIDFNPGSRPLVEFLANHGDYAGCWMILPAAVGAYALPDAKLYGVLAAAMAIEVVWYLRHRWNSKRRLYALGDHDLLVLNKQAKGNVEGFAERNGIRELKLLNDGAQWYGCSKNTLPCAFNLYTNRLGLNTSPCCREHMKDIAYYVSSCLKDMKVTHWLEGGSLLGAVRENGNLLAWEDDVDISLLLDDTSTWNSIAKELSDRGKRDGYYIDVFAAKGFIGVSYDRPLPWPLRWERNRMRGEIRLDLVAYRRAVSHGQAVVERRIKKGAMPMTESGWFGVPEETVLPTSTIRFLGDDMPCPNQPRSYLHSLYGDYQKIEFMYVNSAAAETRRSADTG